MFVRGNSDSHDLSRLPASERHGPDCRMQTLTVMFTDMAGSSRFAEKFGARSALQKRKRHNGLLLPLIESHRGRLVEIVGDALMVVFEEAADAARCAIAMQRRLAEYNRSDDVDVDDLEIHIRVGIHTGKLVVYRDGGHFEVAGRAVNVAARVEAANRKKTDQILLSGAVRSALAGDASFCVEPLATVKPKGIGRLQIYRLDWQDDDAPAMDEVDSVVPEVQRPDSLIAIPRPQVLAASSASPALASAGEAETLRACHSLFLDVENGEGHVLPVCVRLVAGQPHSISSRIDCDAAMRESASEAVRSAFVLLRCLGFAGTDLADHAVEWWVGNRETRYEGASLGLAVGMATIAAFTGLQVEPRTAVTGAIEGGRVTCVAGVLKKWSSLRSLGGYSRLIVAPGNLADLPAAAWSDPGLKISAVPTLEAAVAEVFGGIGGGGGFGGVENCGRQFSRDVRDG